MDDPTLHSYNTHAAKLASAYEAADLSPTHALLLRHLHPSAIHHSPATIHILDIGAGSGRDAAFLHAQGFRVTATDASPAMLAELTQRHPELVGCCLEKSFPFQPDDPLLAAAFDAVTCFAMLMHVPNHDLFECGRQFSLLLKPGGILFLSISTRRAGLADGRDELGRLYIERPPEQIQLLLERLGFRLIARDEQDDFMNRPIHWTTLVLEKATDAPGHRTVDQIESVISKDKKDATYKIALLRALCSIAQTENQAVRWANDKYVEVPLGLIAEKWLFYYWPLIELDPDNNTVIIPQKRGLEKNKRIAFRTPLLQLIKAYGAGGINAAYADFMAAKVPRDLKCYLDQTINKISATIVSGPVTYSGGGQQPHFRFQGRQTANGQCFDPRSTCAKLCYIRVPVAMWRELCLIGQWIGESLILRWAELTHEISNKCVPVTQVIERLLIHPEADRDVQFARSIFEKQFDLECVWTRAPLRKDWHVDHAVPYSVWHNNDLWNLFPCSKRANSDKSNKLVTVELIHKRRNRIIQYWELMHQHAEERFSIELSRSLLHDHGMSNWQTRAFNGFIENVELIAVQRGTDRWDGLPKTKKKPSSATTHTSTRPRLLSYEEVEDEAFKTALPYVASLAAGSLNNGFSLSMLDEYREAQWLRVPAKLGGPKRFIVRVDGNSMEPTFQRGDFLIFEYHRTLRQDGQVVIVNASENPDLFIATGIKRLKQTKEDWLIISDNPAFPTEKVSKSSCPYPILGTYVGKLSLDHSVNL
jgi:phage repressor protein C with HTH and peptisase S24 domain/SAM-dependent methyltransferase